MVFANPRRLPSQEVMLSSLTSSLLDLLVQFVLHMLQVGPRLQEIELILSCDRPIELVIIHLIIIQTLLVKTEYAGHIVNLKLDNLVI